METKKNGIKCLKPPIKDELAELKKFKDKWRVNERAIEMQIIKIDK